MALLVLRQEPVFLEAFFPGGGEVSSLRNLVSSALQMRQFSVLDFEKYKIEVLTLSRALVHDYVTPHTDNYPIPARISCRTRRRL